MQCRKKMIAAARSLAVALLLGLAVSAPGRASDLVTIISPSQSSVMQKLQLFEGKIEEPFPRSVRLGVEPFLAKDGEKALSRRIEVRDGYFSEQISLFPGLNLIRLSTLNGRELAVVPVFFISPDSGLLNQGESWGTQSSVVFTAPAEVKTSVNPVVVKGVVTDPVPGSFDVVVLDPLDLLTGDVERQKQHKIAYLKVRPSKQQLSFPVTLREGLNIILAKPSGTPAAAPAMQIKSILFERVSPHLAVAEPEIKGNKLLLSGKAEGSLFRTVTIKVSALVEKRSMAGKMVIETIASVKVVAGPDGSFSVKIPWETGKGDYVIKAFPTVYFYAGGETATRTITAWQ